MLQPASFGLPVPVRVAGVDDTGCACLAATGPIHAIADARLDPVAGDWALLAGHQLVGVLPPVTTVRRGRGPGDVRGEVLAANVDVVLVVQAFAVTPSPRQTERLLALALATGAEPVLVLSQADRAADDAESRSAMADLAVLAEGYGGVPVIGVSTVPDHPLTAGLSRLRTLLSGVPTARTAAVVGPAGCGKSALVNAVAGTVGRQSRPGSALVPLPGGGALIDTPGRIALPGGSAPGSTDDWLAERYATRLRAEQRARWQTAVVARRRRRPLAGGA